LAGGEQVFPGDGDGYRTALALLDPDVEIPHEVRVRMPGELDLLLTKTTAESSRQPAFNVVLVSQGRPAPCA
jgi:hypothetical protein